MKHWTPGQLTRLRVLRERFLNRTAGAEDYWRTAEDLALYDATFADRIGWKWDAVLRELTLRGWAPRSRHVLDWGCGTGSPAGACSRIGQLSHRSPFTTAPPRLRGSPPNASRATSPR
jgi:hypothetical protein